ncbi:DUF7385 family protein [Candidatus Halobonum tyrrellensis]|uniref:Flagella cluster protein n=1 Tax=Candidatus Halobonum tyrrellensis G22 TaxID=1324957 RepID=V4IW92_9EURY|nr:hypothetical protein [Candidatus Halobonum tyrrellensis]ESP87447.1 hypothetical protein K933_14268 [Candidatus Halobonum tyrrellensis G22]
MSTDTATDRLDVSDGFDVHDYRSKLKLLRQTGDSMTLENRAELGCPACDRPFERLLVSEGESLTVDSPPAGRLCVVRTDDRTLLVAH